jgi:undecaprenyl-diphosphatase
MSDTSVLLFINGLAGRVQIIDEFFQGFSNDYFPMILTCLIIIWMWFATRSSQARGINQWAVITAVISIAVVSGFVTLGNAFYFRPRPFSTLPAGSLHLLFYRPTDSSFPSNLAAVTFAVATSIFIKNKKYGSLLLALSTLSSFGRVYMGVHYPLDIIGGAAIGVLSSFISFGIARLLKPYIENVLNYLQRNSLA